MISGNLGRSISPNKAPDTVSEGSGEKSAGPKEEDKEY